MSRKNEIPAEIQALADRMAPHVVSAKTEYRLMGKKNVYDLWIGLKESPFNGPGRAACDDLTEQFRAMGVSNPLLAVGVNTKGYCVGIAPFGAVLATSFKDKKILKAFTRAIKKAKDAEFATPTSRVSAAAPAFKPAS